ncbi:MAG: hypothetical protein ACT4QB_02885 [Gammaproteobacteria bacterium]
MLAGNRGILVRTPARDIGVVGRNGVRVVDLPDERLVEMEGLVDYAQD